MTSFLQFLRNRFFSRAFIILQRQPEENSNQEQNSSTNEALNGENEADQPSDDYKAEDKRNEGQSNSAEIDENVSSSTEMATYNTKKRKFEILKSEENLIVSESIKAEIDFMSLYSDLKMCNDLETRCKSTLSLALCLVHDLPDIEFSDLMDALNDLADSHNFPDLAVSHALLLCAFTKMSMSLEELEMLEDCILSLTGSLKRRDILHRPKMYKTAVLVKDHNEIALNLCQKLFSESYLDLWEIDISTICCCTLCNLSSLVKQHNDELGAKYSFKNGTLKYILGMTGKSTQEIVSEFMISQKQSCPSVSSHRVNQCLQVLEYALSVNPDISGCESLQHESFSLPHCLTRLLGWSVSSVFPSKDTVCESTDSDNYKFHLTTLICILKVLSVLSFNPHQYDSFTNVKGLMEKILICTLKAYFESESNHFDIQMLCLEMLINLYIKNQKTFVLLCLKRFRISESEEILAVEALLKMLSDNLEKIKEVKESTPYPQNNNENKSNEVSINTSSDKDPSDEDSNETPKTEMNKGLPDKNSDKNPENDEVKEASNGNKVNKTDKVSHEKRTNENSSKKSEKENNVESDPVLLAASKDMELSTIVSFICVLVVFFMISKQSFKEFILSKLTTQVLKEATDVSRKFLEFASLTGGMPVTGILILTQTINKLQAMQTA